MVIYKQKIRGLLLGGIIITSIFGSYLISDLLSIYKGSKDIWWNPKSMMLSLEDASNKFELYINGKPLNKYIEKGTLLAKDNEGKTYKVVSKDIGVRLNNWYQQKAILLTKALWSAFGAGFGISLLIIGLYLKFPIRKD